MNASAFVFCAASKRRAHPAILSDGDFALLQERLARRSRQAPRSEKSIRTRSAQRALLDGIAFCANCGGCLAPVKNKEGYAAYRCRKSGKGGCLSPGGASVGRLDGLALDTYRAELGSVPETPCRGAARRRRHVSTEGTTAAGSDARRRAAVELLLAQTRAVIKGGADELHRIARDAEALFAESA